MSAIGSKKKRTLYRFLLARDGDKCYWCRRCFTEDYPFTIDHYWPMSQGGSKKKVTNLVLACLWCNNVRGNMGPDEFVVWLKGNLVERTGRIPSKHQKRQMKNREINGVMEGISWLTSHEKN